jgi:hypothetical protein
VIIQSLFVNSGLVAGVIRKEVRKNRIEVFGAWIRLFQLIIRKGDGR